MFSLTGGWLNHLGEKSTLNFVSWLRVHTNINIVRQVAVWRTSSLWTRRGVQFLINNIKNRTSIYKWKEIHMSDCEKEPLPYKYINLKQKNFNIFLKYFLTFKTCEWILHSIVFWLNHAQVILYLKEKYTKY